LSDDLRGLGLVALSPGRAWTEREIVVEDGDCIKTVLKEFVDYEGSGDQVIRRWSWTSFSKASGQATTGRSLTDDMVEEYFPEADIDLLSPPEDVGKSKEELLLEEARGEIESPAARNQKQAMKEAAEEASRQ
jgi:hypothetical protein